MSTLHSPPQLTAEPLSIVSKGIHLSISGTILPLPYYIKDLVAASYITLIITNGR